MLIYFIKGKLPWQGIPAENKTNKYELIGKMKQEVLLDELCDGIPAEFKEYLSYVRALEFKAKPNYKYLYELFVTCFKNKSYVWDNYDWRRGGPTFPLT